MKKILTILMCAGLVFSSCNKNKKFNKTLDGTWIETSEDGQAVTADDALKITFSKSGKDDGKVTIEDYEDGVQQAVVTGTYKITDKGKTLTIDASGDAIIYKSKGTISDQTTTKFKTTETISGTILGLPFNETQVVEYSKQ